jgi:hypothetical protein
VPVVVTTTYPEAVLRLRGYDGDGSGIRRFDAAPGEVGFAGEGRQRLALELAGEGGTTGLQVRIEAGGRVVQESRLPIPSRAGE